MVLGSSQLMQVSPISLLQLIPEHLAVTLEESLSFTEPATFSSKLEFLLNNLQKEDEKSRNTGLERAASVDSNLPDNSDVFYEGLQQGISMGNDNDVCSLPQVLPGSAHVIRLHTMSAEALNHSDSGLTHPELSSLDDIETDCDPVSRTFTAVTSNELLDSISLSDAGVLSSSFSSSEEDDVLLDDDLSSDPRFVKKFEQALKLGYSEKNVVKVLRQLGPDCGLNDLLSQLISLGDSNPDVALGHTPSHEADFEGYVGVDYTNADSSCSSTLSSSAGLLESGLNSSSLTGSIVNTDCRKNLHYIIIDGSNLAMSHGKNVFSCKGIQIAVDWFQARGHDQITVFVPQWRKEASRPDALITDQDILYDLEKQGIVVFTPARRVKGRRVVCYDDRFILKLAVDTGGIVVSNDVYRDLVREREEYRQVVDQRLLMYSFVNDRFMPPEDPLGRMGPTLDDFLCKAPVQPHPRPQNCPYGKKCTYGNKCRFYHPERGFAPQKSITETLKEQAHIKLQDRASKVLEMAEKGKRQKQKLSRTNSIPVESLPPPAVTADASGAGGRKGKPKLGHSQSLIMPSKSSDYLNEPRKKLEESELASILEQMVIEDLNSAGKCSSKVCDSSEADTRLQAKTPSPRSSPSHQREALIQKTLSSDRHLSPTPPMNYSNTNSPGTSPTLQNKTPSETPEKYISGHLLLANKLSYENKERSFFSDHVTHSSSTQVSSAALSAGKTSELVQFPQKDFRAGQDISINTPVGSPQLYLLNKEQNQQQAYVSVPGHCPDLSSSATTSTHTVGTHLLRQQFDSGVASPPFRHEVLDRIKLMDARSPDSGIYISTEGMSRPYQTHYEGQFQGYKSYPPSNISEVPQQLTSLHRAFSSTDNVTTAEEFQRRNIRRMSSFTVSQNGGDLMVPNQYQQHGMPAALTSTSPQFGMSPGLTRQNSFSDPQIHSSTGVGNLSGVLSSTYQDTNVSNVDNYYPSQNQQIPKQFQYFQQQNLQQNYQQNQRNNHDLFNTPQHQQQLDSSQFHQLTSKPSLANRGQSGHSANPGNIFSSGEDAASQGQSSPHQSAIFFQNTSHIPLFASSPLTPHTPHFPPSPLTPHTPHFASSPFTPHTPHFPPSPLTPHTPHFPSSTPIQSMPLTPGSHIYSSFHNQSTSPHPQAPSLHSALYRQLSSNYFSTGHDIHSHPMSFQQSTIPQNSSPSLQSTVNSPILKEDSAILPNDARYTIYYHLSSVFGEQIVKKVLNLNPDITDPTQICQLLVKYRESGI
ncbi:hypothetical protein BsWGS_27794 [Bradybaena similaris]